MASSISSTCGKDSDNGEGWRFGVIYDENSTIAVEPRPHRRNLLTNGPAPDPPEFSPFPSGQDAGDPGDSDAAKSGRNSSSSEGSEFAEASTDDEAQSDDDHRAQRERLERRRSKRRSNSNVDNSASEGESSNTDRSASVGETTDDEQSDDDYRPKGRGSGRRGAERQGTQRRGSSNAGILILGGGYSHTDSSATGGESSDDERSDDEYQPENEGKRPAASPPPSGGRAMSKRKRKANVTTGRGTEKKPFEIADSDSDVSEDSVVLEADDGSGDINDKDLEDESLFIRRNHQSRMAGRSTDAPSRAGEAVAPSRQRSKPVQRFSARTKKQAWQKQEAEESYDG